MRGISGSDLAERLAAPPVFVVGNPRSGTTWLFEVLEAHPEVAGVFESWMFHEQFGFAGMFDRRLWNAEIIGRWEREFGRGLGLGPLASRDEVVADVRELSSRWLGRALGPEHRFLVEKTPMHLHFAPLIGEVFPEARFVEVIRDGRDVAVSTLAAARGWHPEIASKDGDSTSALGVADLARDWRICVDVGARHEKALAGRWLRVRFEDLRADFAGTVSQVLTFCGIPADAKTVERMHAATAIATHETGERRFRRAGRVGDWRSEFSLYDAWRFDRVAGEALVETGYETSQRWWRSAAVPRWLRRRRASG